MTEPLHEVYVVTIVEYIDGDAADPVMFIFNNEVAANECFNFFSKRNDIKLFMEKETVCGRFMVAQEGNNGEG